jgi:hypothetical protein
MNFNPVHLQSEHFRWNCQAWADIPQILCKYATEGNTIPFNKSHRRKKTQRVLYVS